MATKLEDRVDVLVFNYSIAKTLIREGYIVTDIEKNKKTNTTIFYFRDENNIRTRLQEMIALKKESRQNQ